MTAVISVASGSARVGKTLLSANLAHYLSRKGNRTALLVAGSGAPVFNVQPQSTWPNLINGRIPIRQNLHADIFGLDMMVSQGHGHALKNLTVQATDRLAASINELDPYAYLVVDMAAGLTAPTMACCLAATEPILVITTATKSLSAGYEWLARLSRHGFKGPINVVLNQVKTPARGQTVFARFKDLAQQRLKVQVNLWGSLSFEEAPGDLGYHDAPLATSMPSSKLLREIQTIGDRLMAEQPPENQTQPLNVFWKAFIGHLNSLPVMPLKPAARKAVDDDAADRSTTPLKLVGLAEEKEDSRSAISGALSRLTEQLSLVAGELAAIRRHLQDGAIPANETASGKPGPSKIETVLDFDAFVARHEEGK
jgi:MinD-like ATPase involved in chromosome partitioning or flagellar assembly